MPDEQPNYVHLILPLPLEGLFTYAVPPELQADIDIGKRVVVQFGKRKLYTALISNITTTIETGANIKEIIAIIDEQPIVTSLQLQLWQWMAHYYICTLGEIMNAALPSGLKLNSETQLYLDESFKPDTLLLSGDEFALTESLGDKDFLTIYDVQHLLNKKTVYPLINKLKDKGIIHVREQLIEKYKVVFEDYLELVNGLDDENLLNEIATDLEKKAPARYRALVAYLDLATDSEEVNRKAVQKKAIVSAKVIAQMTEAGIFKIYKKQKDRLPGKKVKQVAQYQLTPEQQLALNDIQSLWNEKDVVLLHGITSSGKTHIYIELIKDVITKGKQVLYMLPEIAITTQIVQRLEAVFGDKIGVYHSKFNDNERVEIWNKTLSGKYQIILGVRSSVFLPFNNLGLVIVDEEHDQSFKQFEPAPRYQARDTAIYLASLNNAKVLLGSGTPAVESYFNAELGKYALVNLTERYRGLKLPDIEVVDIREAIRKKKMHSHFSNTLFEAIKKCLDNKEQVILFQNRRGYSPYLICIECGWIPQCSNCDVSLTYHKFQHNLKCHYCSFQTKVPEACYKCGSTNVQMRSFGTEKIEDELGIFFPEARVARLDLDTTKTKYGHVDIINDFADGITDILVGTQMITKGLDFDNVSLVGIMDADQMLNYPDYIANERAFQLMEQVSGRAGRKFKSGKVIIQTFQPDHHIISAVSEHNYAMFYKDEKASRNEFHYPPYYRLIKITLKHKHTDTLGRATFFINQLLRKKIQGEILGPAPALISRVRNYYLNDFLIKVSKKSKNLNFNKQVIKEAINHLHKKGNYPSVRVSVQVDY